MEQVKENNSHKIGSLTLEQIRRFTHDQFLELKKEPSIEGLIHFQTINKFLFMAFDQEQVKILGNFVANKEKKNFTTILMNMKFFLIQS